MPPPDPHPITVLDVGLDSRTAGAEAVYTYLPPKNTPQTPAVGQAVFVPLGPRQALGYVLAQKQITSEQDLGFPLANLRPIASLVDGLSLPSTAISLVHEVARQTLTPVAICLALAAPPGIRDRLVKSWTATPTLAPPEPLTPAQQEALHTLRQKPLREKKGAPLPKGLLATLRALKKRGLAQQNVALAPLAERARLAGAYHLTNDRAKVEAFLAKQGKKKPAQAITLMRLQGSEAADFTIDEIKALGQVSEATVKALVDAHLLEPSTTAQNPLAQAPTPTNHQAQAIHHIVHALESRSPQTILIYGITGSGKTEVYLRAAEAALKLGRQVLYLVPEIALTAQVIAQLRARFGKRVAVLHSNMTPTERMESWSRVRAGEAPVVLGPRSALFAPLHDIGLIVMDEEHEASYKQENTPRYQAKNLAAHLAQTHQCPLVLGSATPSIETFYQAETGQIHRIDLPTRAAAANLPPVHIVDLREAYKDRRASVFSPELAQALQETLDDQAQAILFLNRRAFAPFVVCRECGHRFTCPHCAVSLAFHRKDKKLRCHHCDHQEPAPLTCPECESPKVNTFGIGAEKVEEAVATQFSNARVARLDRDVARRKGALEETLAQFRAGELNVLVGTQMVAKGLDFPNVTLVGVIAADISLNIPDFRASERTFQLLTQVAGRAGRGVRPGKVIVQTLSADHPSVLTAQNHDYLTLYNHLVQERRDARYPPFVRLVKVLFTSPDRHAVYELSAVAGQKLRLAFPNELEGEILGPVDCSLERLNNLWRRQIVLKLHPQTDLQRVADPLATLPTKAARYTIDVDPNNLV